MTEITHKARVEYRDVPDLARQIIGPLIARYQALFPTWAQLIYVYWGDAGDGKGATIECQANYVYRFFSMTFDHSFLAQREDDHRTQVIHEILHASSCVLADWARDTISRLVPESEAPKFRESLLEELRQRHESFVQDLALRLAEALK
jgi:hypothetical protein